MLKGEQEQKNSRRALFTGSFDPITNGHLDLIRRAAPMFDELVVGVIVNPQKNSLFTTEEREELIRLVTADIPHVQVDRFSGLLADYVNEQGFCAVIRGLRNSTDFNYEISMDHMNARLFDRAETVYLMTDPAYGFLSSTMAKEVVSLGGNGEGLVPDAVLRAMKAKFHQN
ncbi:pantetheine-phosphate adenylyltransferase [uncultured Eubacterium sp.]|uniref:pantetheine-phosphate adenylyltransferase n=1 Tax=Eubacterium pyruvativorans TaxID=155865 RepID=UPI000E86D9F1|nr:pantetheine-phosphate adenylyltransferase [uncultured Eubacterium sp.]MDO5567946.1 pantetheine-phosphate adenylyltransferase [Eubacteriales bacterium]HAT82978.1 pantetheine-phosphate adenylyltransferase [Eubacterium sp.]